MIKRQKTIDTLRSALDNEDILHIALVGEKGIGKSTLLRELEEDGFYGESGSYKYYYLSENEGFPDDNLKKNVLIIIDTEDVRDESFWGGILEKLSKNKIIFAHNEKIFEETVENISLGNISYREYSDSHGYPIDISKILSGESDIEKLNSLKDIYMERGGFPRHLIHPETIYDDFSSKRAILESKVFKKEKEQFIEFTRTLAMNVGSLFKADQLAKILSISRRKVNKYKDLLLEEGIIRVVPAWGKNTETETFRHEKIYFTDLSILKVLLGDTYGQGPLKLGAIENFIYLELERKLDANHSISYYRKKSGAEITFIIENLEKERITPVEVSLRDADVVSQAFRSFDDDYHDVVERYMLVNATRAGKKDINGTAFIVLPHVAI